MPLTLFSPDFNQTVHIPSTYTCQGRNINPTFRIFETPANTKSFALIMEDPDAATDPAGNGQVFDHWILYNIPPDTPQIEEGTVPAGAVQGKNSEGKNEYTGPCPPTGPHLYKISLYALDTLFNANLNITKKDLLTAIEGHIIEQTYISGIYQKTPTVTQPGNQVNPAT